MLRKKIFIPVFILSSLVTGCYITRESDRQRDDYFQPIPAVPQRSKTGLSGTEVDQLRIQLESAAYAARVLRDSLSSLQNYTGSLLASTRSLLDKISELEAKAFLADNKQKRIEDNIAELRSENKQLSREVTELRTQFVASREVPEHSYSPRPNISGLLSKYQNGLLFFHQKKYEKSYSYFKNLLNDGIEEDLADNCEYWIGECRFAQKEYREAIGQFQRVISIVSSNKRTDAIFMLGRSYELMGELPKARQAYEELDAHYPGNLHSKAVKSKLEMLRRMLKVPAVGSKSRSSV